MSNNVKPYSSEHEDNEVFKNIIKKKPKSFLAYNLKEIKELKKNGLSYQQIYDYLKAQHGVEFQFKSFYLEARKMLKD